MASGPAEEVAAYRVVTVPNALSVLRLLGVPLFLWLLLGPHADVAALVVLALSGLTDWADGVLARKLNQTSKLGALLDPAVDRLYILATLIGLTLRHIIPGWLAAVIIARDLLLLLTLPVLRRHGYGPLQVSLVGKTATLCLLYAFPLLLLGAYAGPAATVARVAGWAFGIWGTALYWWAAGLYLAQTWQLTAGTAGDPAGGAQS